MKFSFENTIKKTKDIAKKNILYSGIVASSLSPSIEKNNKETFKKNENLPEKELSLDIDSSKDYEKQIINTIGWDESLVSSNTSENISSEDKTLIENIKKMEEKFSELSNEKFKIMEGSISIISNQELTQKLDSSKYEDIDGLRITSPLKNNYITNSLNCYIVNNLTDIKILDKTSLIFDGIKETKKMNNDGNIELKEDGYSHFIPEYYFIIDQEQENDSTIKFKIKIISSKVNENIKNFSIVEKLPEGNPLKDPNFISFVDNKIVPDIGQKIEEFIKNFSNNY